MRLRSDPEIRQQLEAARLAWLSVPGASEAELVAAEERLRRKLPPSYRAFLATTNGWACAGHSSSTGGAFLPAARILRFRVEDRDWIQCSTDVGEGPDLTPEEHLASRDGQDPSRFRGAYLWDCVKVSNVSESGVYLLNPSVKTDEGEWEAWYFANWLPGARRYASFRLLIEHLVREARGT